MPLTSDTYMPGVWWTFYQLHCEENFVFSAKGFPTPLAAAQQRLAVIVEVGGVQEARAQGDQEKHGSPQEG